MTYIEKHEWEEKYNEATGRADFFEPNSLVIPINSAILLTRMLLATSITQALAEERVRVDKEITKQFKYASENDNYDMRGVDWQSILHPSDLLSALDKPLTDKE